MGESTCGPHVIPKVAGVSLTAICGQVEVKPAVRWQALAVNRLLSQGRENYYFSQLVHSIKTVFQETKNL
jgi:hypothetical protein